MEQYGCFVDYNYPSPYYFYSLFKFLPHEPEVLITGIHAPTIKLDKNALWSQLGEDLPPHSTPRLVIGDMNKVTNQAEKMGGRKFTNTQGNDFISWVDCASLIDLGYHGANYTWNNCRECMTLIRERLDRSLANALWLKLYANTRIKENQSCYPMILLYGSRRRLVC